MSTDTTHGTPSTDPGTWAATSGDEDGPPDAPPYGGADATGPTGAGGGAVVPRRSLAALLVAAVLVVGVVALVLIFGVARPPELVAMADQPDPAPSASVAWTRWDDGFACVDTLTPDGTVTEVACDLEGEEILAWDADGIALWVWGPRELIELLDPATGEVVDSHAASGQLIDDRPMDALRVRHDEGTLTVQLRDTGEVLWEVDAHENYRVRAGTRSPDGGWVAMFDSAGRLLVVSSDGSMAPRVWHETGEHWQTPVWEGTPLPQAPTD